MTPLQEFFAFAGLLLTLAGLCAAYLLPKHRVRQKFFDRALGNSGADGMPQQDDIFTVLERVVHQLNGGGFGAQIKALDKKVTDHIEEATQDRHQIQEDVREVRSDVAGLARVFSIEIQKLDEKVTGDLRDERDRSRYLEASLNELLTDDSIDLRPDEGDDDGGGR